ncbi:hypothetical protein [Enterovibrio norvegicus]|uniref:Uncharacterized protein n=1 Tax=Enterovibrio norvegicus TaxID=188144 RepID=A0A2N7LA79_9GAMM|nr:hypothetical protein [Enterovibrio norvegicus]PMN91337.1 hypothetical protein BCT23_17660 [Enterovibrio norvegicus]
MVGEVKIAFAKKILTDEIVCIDDVEQGLKCDCICLSCGTQVVARHGKVNAHCFAHITDNDLKTQVLCSYSPETSLALLIRQELVKLNSIDVFDYEEAFEYTLKVNTWELDVQSEYGTVDIIGTTDMGHRIGIYVPFPGSEKIPLVDRDFHLQRWIRVKNSPLLDCQSTEDIANMLRQHATLYRELQLPPSENHLGSNSALTLEHDDGYTPPSPKITPEVNLSNSEEDSTLRQSCECQLCFQYYVPMSKKICRHCVSKHVGKEFKNIRELYKAFDQGWQPKPTA